MNVKGRGGVVCRNTLAAVIEHLNALRACRTLVNTSAMSASNWRLGGKILQLDQQPLKPGQPFIHLKLGCYGTVLTPIAVDVCRYNNSDPNRIGAYVAGIGPNAAAASTGEHDVRRQMPLLRPAHCYPNTGMAQVFAAPGLELYVGGGNKDEGYTVEGYGLPVECVLDKDAQWYRVLYHERAHRGNVGLKTTPGALEWASDMQRFVPGLARCPHTDLQPIAINHGAYVCMEAGGGSGEMERLARGRPRLTRSCR